MANKADRLELRLSEEKKARWAQAAKDLGYTLTEFIEGCVEAELAGSKVLNRSRPTRALSAEGRKDQKAKAKRARTDLCEHRIPPTSHCAQCD